jgi:hypothetical protein
MAFGGEDKQYNKKIVVPAVVKVTTKKNINNNNNKNVGAPGSSFAYKVLTEDQKKDAQGKIASGGFGRSEQNAQFIYPATRDKVKARDAVGGTTINRGYVRRLTEFYARQSSGSDTPSVLNNLKCNFQFNPDSITRAIQSDTSMQFFFNQDPNQLTQPVPGKAGYAFDLLFNREAEVNSGKYLVGGKLQTGKRADTTSSSSEQLSSRFLDAEKYDPAWVTEIGVLADIMVLDDILGVGLAKDVVKAINDNALKIAEEGQTGDSADAPKTTKETSYDSQRMTNFSSNLGNKAFLVPQPIRVVFSNWMMVEGFVTSSQVTFNKFTRGFIPTQCSVAVQMQALYIGFVQQKTFLTDMPMLPKSEIDGVDSESDLAETGSAERDLQDATIAGMADFIKSATWVKGSFNDLAVSTFLSKGEQKVKNINFTIIVSDKGAAFFKSIGSSKDAGGGVEFTFSGTIKVSWHSYVNNASNSRTVNGGNATSASALTYSVGAPPDTSSAKYSQYGTSSKPLVISIDDHPIKYKVDVDRGITKTEDVMVYGKNPTYRWGSEGSDATWTWEFGSELTPRPFNQDKFNVELEITTFCTRAKLGKIELPQKITMKSTGINYNQVMGLTKLTVNK